MPVLQDTSMWAMIQSRQTRPSSAVGRGGPHLVPRGPCIPSKHALAHLGSSTQQGQAGFIDATNKASNMDLGQKNCRPMLIAQPVAG